MEFGYDIFFGFVHPRPTTRLPWAWEATPYNGSLCEYVEVGESKITQNMGKYIWVGKNYGHIGRSDVDNLMPATRPEIDQLN